MILQMYSDRCTFTIPMDVDGLAVAPTGEALVSRRRAGLGLLLATEDAAALAAAGVPAPGALRLPLVELRAPVDALAAAQLRVLAQQAARRAGGPVSARVVGVGPLALAEGETVLAAVVAGDALERLRDSLRGALEEVGASEAARPAPLVVLPPLAAGEAALAAAPVPVEVRFDRLALALGEQEVWLPLAATAAEFHERWGDGANLADVCAAPQPWTLLYEFADPPAPPWIPFLPRPGTYTHPTYGTIVITAERNARFVDHFRRGIYQVPLPVSAEHEPLVSGALGWIVDLRQNDDGSVDALVEWTDRGRALLADGRFKFISPEWWDVWVDPVDGTEYRDIATGAALTVRPFFKPKVLRPLLAREGALWVAREPADRGEVVFEPVARRDGPAVAAVAFTEREEETHMTDPETTVIAEPVDPKQFAEVLDQNKRLTERIAAMEREARRRRFSEEVEGRSAASGRRWFGEVGAHVQFMEAIAAAFGEDSDQLQHYIAINRAFAEHLATSALFGAAGVSGDPAPAATATAELLRKVEQAQRERGLATVAEAVRLVAAEDPRLYRRYRREALAPTAREED